MPVASSISVTDNGVAIPATSSGGTANWTYDAVANALRFAPGVTAVGDPLQVNYTLACGN